MIVVQKQYKIKSQSRLANHFSAKNHSVNLFHKFFYSLVAEEVLTSALSVYHNYKAHDHLSTQCHGSSLHLSLAASGGGIYM